MKKRLITSALPYVNNIPHLGNLIQVLSADVFARFCRLRAYETLYVCGSDEYGTATETKAMEEGISPRELCDKNHAIHKDIYSWFNINFDHYGRTSSHFQSDIVQDIFLKVYNAGYVSQRTIKQLYSEKSKTFLADRYVRGECPHCHYDDARGDQCESCGKLLDPEHLINPVSILDNSAPILKETTHLYINLPAILPLLQEWMDQASAQGHWAHNALSMTQAWIRDGLKERAITRDLKWGIPVPLEGFENKVFYVWFDAPIGYISISAEHASTGGNPEAWKSWWQNPDEVELFQFIGKDNIPFHTVLFPSSLLASAGNWTLLHHMSSTEYMNYEGGKFSKSKGIGVFASDARDTEIPADVWRFYLLYNRPETSDYTFTWKDFQDAVNKELIGNFANLVNRSLRFHIRFFDKAVYKPAPDDPRSREFWKEVAAREAEIANLLEWAQLRDALRHILALSDYGNKVFQEAEPWKLKNSDPHSARAILSDLIFLVRDLAVLLAPFIPETAGRVAGFLNVDIDGWEQLAVFPRDMQLEDPQILLKPLDAKHIASMSARFSGSQTEREAEKEQAQQKKKPKKKPRRAEIIRQEDAALSLAERFTKRVELRVAKITAIERHPNADTLYIETLDDGSGKERRIVSGLVPHYSEEELLNRNIIVVANLKPAKLRGVLSEGMLLAASPERMGESGAADESSGAAEPVVDVIFADHARPGDQIAPHGTEAAGSREGIDIDTFFDIPLCSKDHRIVLGNVPLEVAGQQLRSERVSHGSVG